MQNSANYNETTRFNADATTAMKDKTKSKMYIKKHQQVQLGTQKSVRLDNTKAATHKTHSNITYTQRSEPVRQRDNKIEYHIWAGRQQLDAKSCSKN